MQPPNITLLCTFPTHKSWSVAESSSGPNATSRPRSALQSKWDVPKPLHTAQSWPLSVLTVTSTFPLYHKGAIFSSSSIKAVLKDETRTYKLCLCSNWNKLIWKKLLARFFHLHGSSSNFEMVECWVGQITSCSTRLMRSIRWDVITGDNHWRDIEYIIIALLSVHLGLRTKNIWLD